jgi:hypothetical protein
MQNQKWKLKYQDLKLKFMDAVDVSFRLGFEAGAQNAQVQQAQQQQADAQAAQQAAAMGQQPGQPGQDPNDPNAQPGQEIGQDGSELDSHISQLEGMLGSAKPGSPEQQTLQKSLDGIKAFQSSLKQTYELKKSEQAIKAIAKSMKSPFTLGKQATKNMSQPAKTALSMQEQIVSELMKSMADEEAKASEAITKTLSIEQLLKG